LAAPNDSAVRADSASIYVVLRSSPEFSAIESRLATLLSSLPESYGLPKELLILLQQIHDLNSFLGSHRKTCSQVLKLVAVSAAKKGFSLSVLAAALLANVTALLFPQ
jgi:hypothetical protein